MHNEEQLHKECEKLSLYLTGMRPDNYVSEKYMHAHISDNITIAGDQPSVFDRFMISVATINPFLASLVDNYTKVFFKKALIRKKMVLLLAILESCEPFCSSIDTVMTGSKSAIFFKFFLKASLFMIGLVISTAIFMPFHLLFKLIAW